MKQPIRRVYKPEAKARLGWGDSWLAKQIKEGNLPKPRHDPGAKRIWWPSEEFDLAIEKLNAAATTERVRSPAIAAEERRRPKVRQ